MIKYLFKTCKKICTRVFISQYKCEKWKDACFRWNNVVLYSLLTPALPPDILAFIIPYMFSPEFVESTMIKCTFTSLSKKNTFTMSNYYELSTQSVLTTSNDETSFQDFIVILKITTKRFWRNISSVLHAYWYIVHV